MSEALFEVPESHVEAQATDYVPGQDAAFAIDITTGAVLVFGYFGGPNAYHVWNRNDWGMFPGYKVPIWVAGYNAAKESSDAIAALHTLGVPQGCVIALDMEGRMSEADKNYVTSFGFQLQQAGYKVWVYGEASTVFNLPQLNGYWVADWTGTAFMFKHIGVRATQWAEGPGHDNDLIKGWTLRHVWR
jgi:Domain of unknown function (DUF1906)